MKLRLTDVIPDQDWRPLTLDHKIVNCVWESWFGILVLVTRIENGVERSLGVSSYNLYRPEQVENLRRLITTADNNTLSGYPNGGTQQCYYLPLEIGQDINVPKLKPNLNNRKRRVNLQSFAQNIS